MAGYIINLDNKKSLINYITNGVYSTKIRIPQDNIWRSQHEGTFADYITMNPGDNIFFFIKRKIYGIGELVNVGDDCKYLNFPGANLPKQYEYQEIREELLWDEGLEDSSQRWVCLFKPSPHFFKQGIDMDDVLSSNPSKFRMLRAFWKLSFIKIDDEENKALINVILRFNQKSKGNNNIISSLYANTHKQIRNKVEKDNSYKFNIKDILLACLEKDKIRHEMAIEAALLFQLSNQHEKVTRIFGKWDYLSHQVVASPFKPIDYMDKMDVFGYSFIQGFDYTRSKFLLIEIKKDSGSKEDIEQIMKYIDWVKEEYAFGDYSMINAFLVAYDYSNEVISHGKEVGVRKYTIGRRPAYTKEWSNLKFVEYRFNRNENALNFYLIDEKSKL